jgi:hypothetical protein
MTKRELMQLYYLEKEIRALENRIEELEREIENCTRILTDMPKNRNRNNKIAEIAAEIVDVKRLLDLKKQERIYMRNRILRYIQAIDNCEVRLIIEYRFIDRLSWQQVANRMGGYATAASVRMIANRFLRENQKPVP